MVGWGGLGGDRDSGVVGQEMFPTAKEPDKTQRHSSQSCSEKVSFLKVSPRPLTDQSHGSHQPRRQTNMTSYE